MTKTRKLLKFIIKPFEKVWYNRNENRVVNGVKIMKGLFESKGYLPAIGLAEYIKDRYYNKFNKEISSLKLQKCLYFCFAYWAGFVVKDDSNTEIKEIEENLNPILFDDRIEAWSYGPVVPCVFRHQKECKDGTTSKSFCEKILEVTKTKLEANETLKGAIDDILDDLFLISDFGLVSMSHNDKSWQDNYNENDIKHNREIPKGQIINEYSKKAFN